MDEKCYYFSGYDFCFGQLRKGSAETIEQAGINVTVIDPINDDKGDIISSSRIREKIRKGKIDEANNLLGWEWEIQGSVFRGDRRGHELGYPTANVLMEETLHPAYGVYATLVQIEGEEEWLPAATNIGIRPMFEVPQGQVEAAERVQNMVRQMDLEGFGNCTNTGACEVECPKGISLENIAGIGTVSKSF